MTYTVSKYRPAWPGRVGVAYSVVRGTLEENRDTLSPSLVWAEQVDAANAHEARAKVLARRGEAN